MLAFTVGLLAFLGDRRAARGHRARGRGGRRRWAAPALVWLGAVGRLPRAGRRGRLAERAPRACGDAARRGGARRARRLPGRARDRPPQPRRGARDRVRVRGRLARARAPRWWSASRSTTPPRGSPSWRPVARSGTRAAAHAGPARASLAGAPAILGAWIGASAFNPSLAALMFGIGAGAIAQVIVQIARQMRGAEGRGLTPRRGRRPAARPGRDVRDRPDGERLMAAQPRDLHTRSRTTRRRSTRSSGVAGGPSPRRRWPTGSHVSAASASAMLKRLAVARAGHPSHPTTAPSLTRAGRENDTGGDSPPPPAAGGLPVRSTRPCHGIACTPRPRCSSTPYWPRASPT